MPDFGFTGCQHDCTAYLVYAWYLFYLPSRPFCFTDLLIMITAPLAPATQRANAFTILMGATRALKYPPTSTRNDQRSRQMNGIVDILKAEEAGFSDSSIASGKHFHQVLAELLWKVGHTDQANWHTPITIKFWSALCWLRVDLLSPTYCGFES